MTQAAHEIVVDRPVAEVYGEWADDPRNPLGRIAGSFGVPGRAVARVLERFTDSVDGERRRSGRTSRAARPEYEIQDHPHPPGETAPRGPSLHDASGPGA